MVVELHWAQPDAITVDAVELADVCVKAWRGFLAEHDITVPQPTVSAVNTRPLDHPVVYESSAAGTRRPPPYVGDPPATSLTALCRPVVESSAMPRS